MSASRHLRRTTALCGGALSALIIGAPLTARAQDAPQAQPSTEVEEVVVTGTRLRLPDYEASNPVISLTGEAIENAGVTNITDFLTDMPALTGSTTLQDNSNAGDRGSVGVNLLNLRNLGTQRTLVLVNGRRHVPAQAGDAAIDVNTIPIALIERIETLTGGASAVYGADGVSGVVNFILKDDFEGVDARLQTGFSDGGGGANTFGSVLYGMNFDDDRGNATLALEYSTTERLGREDRYFSSLAGLESLVVNPNFTGAPGEYERVFARNVRYIDTSPGGSVYTDLFFGSIFGDPGSLSGVDYNGDGTPFVDGVYTSGFSMIGGDGSQLAGFGTDLIPGLDRGSIHATLRYDLTPQHTLFAEAKYINTRTQFQSQPTFDYALYVPIDNPFIPASILAAATGPGGIANAIGGVLVARDNFDLGFVNRDVERETWRGVVGLRGELTSRLNYEVSLNYGRTTENNVESNNRINERWFAAIDAVRHPVTGQIVCRSDLDPTAAPLGTFPGFGDGGFDQSTFGTTFTPGANSGCVPANIFGDGVMSQEARDWILTESESSSSIDQFVFNAFITGDTEGFFSLPGGAISYVAGVEYRKETAEFIPSDLELLSATLGADITWLGEATVLEGEFDVSEYFAELSLPLLRDLPLIQNLTIDGAYRHSDYSTAGKTEAWKGGLRWNINNSIMIRATEARSVRAPNIGELFLPQTQTFALLVDPCDDDNYQAGDNPAVREANCRAALGYGPATPYTFNNISSSSIEGVIGGNPALEPEEASTFTAGIVLTPTFLPGLSFALDYYDIELSNAIQFFTAQNILDKCYDLPQPNQFCNLITRDPTTDFVDSFEQFGVNVALYTTSGWDFSVRYILDPADWGVQRDIGRFGLSLVGNKLEDLTFTEDPTDPLTADQELGTINAPEWQVSLDLTWEWRQLFVNYGFNWWDETIQFEGRPANFVDPAELYYTPRRTHDLQARWEIDDRINVYGGVNNLTDQKPDRGLRNYPVSPMGRFFYLGVNLSL